MITTEQFRRSLAGFVYGGPLPARLDALARLVDELEAARQVLIDRVAELEAVLDVIEAPLPIARIMHLLQCEHIVDVAGYRNPTGSVFANPSRGPLVVAAPPAEVVA